MSEDFNVTRLIKEILKSAIYRIDENFDVDGLQNSLKELLKDKKILENLGLDELQFQLRELLKDKKFLLVLDTFGTRIIVNGINWKSCYLMVAMEVKS